MGNANIPKQHETMMQSVCQEWEHKHECTKGRQGANIDDACARPCVHKCAALVHFMGLNGQLSCVCNSYSRQREPYRTAMHGSVTKFNDVYLFGPVPLVEVQVVSLDHRSFQDLPRSAQAIPPQLHDLIYNRTSKHMYFASWVIALTVFSPVCSGYSVLAKQDMQ